MGIRSEKKKILQQIITNDDTSLDIDPQSLLSPGDLHWFEATGKKQSSKDKENESKPDKKTDLPQ
ncbi:hypothetical protein [Pedobacter sp.]|uniref:hypothetical protein n=1 Tax=Pedobacter sp. TaxID=1411316 RepID=UPI003D7FD476